MTNGSTDSVPDSTSSVAPVDGDHATRLSRLRVAKLLESKRRLGRNEDERAFFGALRRELDKVNERYTTFLGEAMRRAANCAREGNPRLCAETHLFLLLVENYAVLNYCGFTKILKKHDKIRITDTKELYMANMVNSRSFVANLPELRRALEAVEGKFQEVMTPRTNAIVDSALEESAPSAQSRDDFRTRPRSETEADLSRRRDEITEIKKQSLDRLKSLADAACAVAAPPASSSAEDSDDLAETPVAAENDSAAMVGSADVDEGEPVAKRVRSLSSDVVQ